MIHSGSGGAHGALDLHLRRGARNVSYPGGRLLHVRVAIQESRPGLKDPLSAVNWVAVNCLFVLLPSPSCSISAMFGMENPGAAARHPSLPCRISRQRGVYLPLHERE